MFKSTKLKNSQVSIIGICIIKNILLPSYNKIKLYNNKAENIRVAYIEPGNT